MKNKKIIYSLIIIVILIFLVIVSVLFFINYSKETNQIVEAIIDEGDLNIDWEEDIDASINLSNNSIIINGTGVKSNNNIVTISSGGVYYFTGTIDDAQIIVDAGKTNEVKIVLSNANITSKVNAPIIGKSASKITITIAEETENNLEDANEYTTFIEDDEPDATLFSKTDLIINGTGTLNIKANYLDGIVSKDTLKIVSGNINVDANDDGIRGKDGVVIYGGNLNITSNGDGIKATNDSDDTLGYVTIENANIEISAGDDGIHAETNLKINSGNININESYEGLEGKLIEINSGVISIVSSDDGINVAGGNDGSAFMNMSTSTLNSNYKLTINGGTINVNSSGDGLDSNGSIYMTGGNVIVSGPTNAGNGALDYDSTFEITGGILVAYGSSGMFQTPSQSSSQYSIAVGTTGKSGDKVVLKDSSGEEIYSFTTQKSYSAIVISAPNITKNKTYYLYINDSEIGTLDISNIVTTIGNIQSGMGAGGGMQKPNRSI